MHHHIPDGAADSAVSMGVSVVMPHVTLLEVTSQLGPHPDVMHGEVCGVVNRIPQLETSKERRDVLRTSDPAYRLPITDHRPPSGCTQPRPCYPCTFRSTTDASGTA